MKRSKRRNHARTVKERPDSSTESNSEEDYAYSVKNKSNPKTKTTICINSRKINFIVDTGATADVIDSKTYDRLQSSVKLSKSTTKYSLMVQTNLCLSKASFKQPWNQINDSQIQLFTSSKEAHSENLLSAKTA